MGSLDASSVAVGRKGIRSKGLPNACGLRKEVRRSTCNAELLLLGVQLLALLVTVRVRVVTVNAEYLQNLIYLFSPKLTWKLIEGFVRRIM